MLKVELFEDRVGRMVIDLARPAGVHVHWHLRAGGAGPLDALRGLELPARERFVFFAAERREAFAARDWLRERGFQRGESFASTYWTADGTAA